MKTKSERNESREDVSWLMLLSVAAVIIGSAYLLSYNVVYTEGEVMQGLFDLLLIVATGCVAIGFYRRQTAIWCITLLGGSLLLWQTYQSQKWAKIHEEIIAILQYAETTKDKVGNFLQI